MARLTRRGMLGIGLGGGLALGGLRFLLPTWLRAGPVLSRDAFSASARALVDEALADLDLARVVDLHVHVAGFGRAGSGCWVNPRLASHLRPLERLRFEIYLAGAGVRDDAAADRDWITRLESLRAAAVPELRLLLLAFDVRVREDGSEDLEGSMFRVPDEHVCALAREHAGFLACASVHPYRTDALERLERAHAAGAVAVKWLPSAMGIDPTAPRCAPFYAKLVELGLPLLVHTGEERAVWVEDAQELSNPLRLRSPLAAGVTVVALHCGSLGVARDLDAPGDTPQERSAFELFQRVLGEQGSSGRLFGEISALTQVNRRAEPVRALLDGSLPAARLLNGSDYPLVAIDPLTSLDLLERRGFLDEADVAPLRELFDGNPLLFDLVLKRRLRVLEGGEPRRFAPEVFESARLFDKL